MTNPHIERAARALMENRWPGSGAHAFQFDTANKRDAIEAARAAIASLIPVSEEMVEAAHSSYPYVSPAETKALLSAAISEALKEPLP